MEDNMTPIFIHVMANGDVWASSNFADTPAGTIAATFRVCSLTKLNKVGTITGNTGSYSCSGHTGKSGKEIV